MTLRHLKALALACVLAPLLALPAWGQQIPDSAYRPDGTRVPTVAMATIFTATVTPFVNMTTATTTRIVAAAANKTTYITLARFHAAGTTTAKLVSGTGSNCGTGTADLTETLDLTASDGMVYGSGAGPVVIVAPGLDTCVVNGQAINLRVGVAAAQF